MRVRENVVEFAQKETGKYFTSELGWEGGRKGRRNAGGNEEGVGGKGEAR